MKKGFILAIILMAALLFSCGQNPKSSSHSTTQNIKNMEPTLHMQSKVSGEGTPLVLVPGGLTGWKSWEPFVEVFSAQQKQVIRVQLLNVQYGIENRDLPSDYSVKTESQALDATLGSLNLTKPLDIVGWSYGALTTLDYALDHPEQIRTLVLIEPPAFWVLRASGAIDDETQRSLGFLETLHGDITEDMLAGFLREAGLLKVGQKPRDLPQWDDWIQYRQSLRNNTAILTQCDKLERLKNLEAPVLLIKGTGSARFYAQIEDILASHLPNARIIEMPGGHAPHIEFSDRFISELEKFQKGKE